MKQKISKTNPTKGGGGGGGESIEYEYEKRKNVEWPVILGGVGGAYIESWEHIKGKA